MVQSHAELKKNLKLILQVFWQSWTELKGLMGAHWATGEIGHKLQSRN